MLSPAITLPAAFAEIAGRCSFWFWRRLNGSALWAVPGTLSLVLFAWLLTLVPVDHAGRAYAGHDGVCIVASLFRGWIVEGAAPDRRDVPGGAVAILLGPRGAPP